MSKTPHMRTTRVSDATKTEEEYVQDLDGEKNVLTVPSPEIIS